MFNPQKPKILISQLKEVTDQKNQNGLYQSRSQPIRINT
uniref:Uncharacterized protein n=1 Tax=Rhizophora mucronata TaxID=61149 RepID=A0A2P2J4I8_RHIMU